MLVLLNQAFNKLHIILSLEHLLLINYVGQVLPKARWPKGG